ncbi:MAG: alpha/beta hydrolase [Acidimicrobiales bacterium]|nr:alpha/beta hydrolase [Acidimicrobiales bacterium]
MTTTIQPINVRIMADELSLAGHLRLPDNQEKPLPALVFTGPFTGVKEQVAGQYAERLAERGFATLAFDHRNFGASDGHRRQHEDPSGKLADLSAATSFLANHQAIDADRIGCVGICMGGGYALKHSAVDRRIKALALVAAAFNDPKVMREGIGADSYRQMMTSFAAVAGREHASGELDYIKAVSDVDGEDAAMPGAEPFEYYGTERSAAPGWKNQMTRLSIRELLTTDLAIGADFIGPTPTLIVHGRTDNFCSPAGAQDAFDRIDGTKELMWLETTNHIDLYDQPSFVGPAIDRIAHWMASYL